MYGLVVHEIYRTDAFWQKIENSKCDQFTVDSVALVVGTEQPPTSVGRLGTSQQRRRAEEVPEPLFADSRRRLIMNNPLIILKKNKFLLCELIGFKCDNQRMCRLRWHV